MRNLLWLICVLVPICSKSQNCNLPSIHFDAGNNKLKREAINDLAFIANFLVQNPQANLVVTGCDTRDSLLAVKRAEKSIAFLIEVCAFERKRFVVKTSLPSKEMLKREEENPRQLFDYMNRRVDFQCIP